MLVLGDPDPSNRSSVDKAVIISMVENKVCDWINKVDNVIPYLQKSKISILPSYREGLPKSLLEAASCELPLIATDVPGCREICKDDFNGILIPKKNSRLLSDAIEKLLKNKSLITTYGQNGRRLVKEKFSLQIVSNQFLKIYQKKFLEKSLYHSIISNPHFVCSRFLWQTWHSHYISRYRNNKFSTGRQTNPL